MAKRSSGESCSCIRFVVVVGGWAGLSGREFVPTRGGVLRAGGEAGAGTVAVLVVVAMVGCIVEHVAGAADGFMSGVVAR